MKNTPRLIPYAKAASLAEKLNADPEDDWCYVASYYSKNPNMGFIRVFDEDSHFVGTL